MTAPPNKGGRPLHNDVPMVTLSIRVPPADRDWLKERNASQWIANAVRKARTK